MAAQHSAGQQGRTTLRRVEPDHLVITHYDITPDGQEYRAVEIAYAPGS
jgi:hypothetical protein